MNSYYLHQVLIGPIKS